MSDLRHPNITLFLGVCFLPNCQLPVLLMERLDSSLDDLLEGIPSIPLVLKRSILEDVSRGLLYLHKHTPQIIHRDLTAKNILLTPQFVAKITDLGNSRIVNLQPGQVARTLSRLPGTMLYMPPEALSASSRYGPSLDVFSFGHLALFTLLQVYVPFFFILPRIAYNTLGGGGGEGIDYPTPLSIFCNSFVLMDFPTINLCMVIEFISNNTTTLVYHDCACNVLVTMH